MRPRTHLANRGLVFGLVVLALLADGQPAGAFASVFDVSGVTNVRAHIEAASRWPSADGSIVVLNVASMPGFGAAIGATPAEVAAANQVVAEAFAAWESPSLQFNVSLEDPGVTGLAGPSPATGFDIDVFAVPSSHPAIGPSSEFFGTTYPALGGPTSRLLTNGQSLVGGVILGADIYLNLTNILPFRTGIAALDAAALRRLLMHEIGHALGLGHPNDNNPFGAASNFDSDSNPLNAMPIDFLDPVAGLMVSPFPHNEAVMSNRPCGEPPVLPCAALLSPLQPDDLGGRDVLYPYLPVRVQSKPQRTCVNQMAARAASLAKSQGSVSRSCAADFAAGRTTRLGTPATAQACLTNDPNGKVFRQVVQLQNQHSRKCLSNPAQMPDFAYAGAAAAIAGAQGESLSLTADLFGATLDAVVVLDAADRTGALCQRELHKRAHAILDRLWALARSAQSQVLAGVASPLVGTAPDLEDAVAAVIAADARGRYQRVVDLLAAKVALRCGDPTVAARLASLFPNACMAGDPAALASCAESRARCRFCESFNESEGLAIGCDLFDDGVGNNSCP